MNLIGIDVDSKLLVCSIERNGRSAQPARFSNDAAGHRQLIKWARRGGSRARVCLEATGVYSLQCSLAVHRASGIELMVVNPRAIRQFAEAAMQRGKTDALDANVILEYLRRMAFQPWQAPSEEALELQSLSRRMVQLNTELTRERNRLHAAQRKTSLGKLLVQDIELNIRHLQQRLKHLQHAALALIRATGELTKAFDILLSTTGIAHTSGIGILAELATLPPDMQPAQWVAHAGLDPRPCESGTSIHKPRRISRLGNRYLRAALYMPALVAIQHDTHVRAFYDKLIAKGKKPMQAIVAVMRKLLHALWGMLHHQRPWQGEKFFAIT